MRPVKPENQRKPHKPHGGNKCSLMVHSPCYCYWYAQAHSEFHRLRGICGPMSALEQGDMHPGEQELC